MRRFSHFPSLFPHLPRFHGRLAAAARRAPILALAWVLAASCPAFALPAATTTTLTVTSDGGAVTTVASGSVVTLTATVTAGTTPLTVGQVNFCDATVAYCTDIYLLATAQLTPAGTATYKFRPGPGSHSYKAVFLGAYDETTIYTSSASSIAALAVTPSGILQTATTIAQSGIAGNYTLTATVDGTGAVAPTGTVQFLDASDGNAVLDTKTLGVGGQASAS